jgi:hypothetical protein
VLIGGLCILVVVAISRLIFVELYAADRYDLAKS